MPSLPYAYFNINGTIIVLATIGGIGANHLYLRKRYVPIAPINVAILPNTISHIIAPPVMLIVK